MPLPEDLDLVYPEELVHRYGAKAGVLMYVQDQLPDIPQMPMVVKTPEESVDDFLRRCDDANFGWPRLFRSSAVEELIGYEGGFKTETVEDVLGIYAGGGPVDQDIIDSYWRGLAEIISGVENSPQLLKTKNDELDLPNQINVIGVEKSPSKYAGSLIKHPNRGGVYYLTVVRNSNAAARDEFVITPETGLMVRIEERETQFEPFEDPNIDELVSWYEQIVSLDRMDPDWAYQLEFGIRPSFLYQVRPFKPIEYADFQVDNPSTDANPIVLGITPKKGINVRLFNGLLDEKMTKSGIAQYTGQHSTLFVDQLRNCGRAENIGKLDAIIFSQFPGFLAHHDITAMRLAQVTILYNWMGEDINQLTESGTMFNIVSDGKQFQITKLG